MDLIGAFFVGCTLIGTLFLLTFWLGGALIITFTILSIIAIPIIAVKLIDPNLGITLFIIEITLGGLILGYNWYSKNEIKKWDKRLPSKRGK